MVVVGLSKALSLFINEQTSSFDEEKQVYIIHFINGTQLEMERKGIKKNIEKYVNEHKEELENALHQAERLQAIETNEEIKEDVSNQAERLQATETQVAVFNNIPVSRLQTFFTLENIEILEKLIELEKTGAVVENFEIPKHYQKLSNGKSVSIRMNEEIYNKMKLYSAKSGETIATITNYLYDMFLNGINKKM
jgi:hypothetical protein